MSCKSCVLFTCLRLYCKHSSILSGHGHHAAPFLHIWYSSDHNNAPVSLTLQDSLERLICVPCVVICRQMRAALSATLSKMSCWTAVMPSTSACSSQLCAHCHSDAAQSPAAPYTTAAVCALWTCKVSPAHLQTDALQQADSAL